MRYSAYVRLAASSVEWLARRCGASAHENDLDVTYSVPHKLNGSRKLTREEICASDASYFRWWIEISTPEGVRVLDAPLARMVYASHELSSAPGRSDHVAYNASFYIAEEFQRLGLASSIYPAEEALYRRWNVAEIQLHALGDGCVVWIKKFGFQIKDPEVLETDYPGWARINRVSPIPPEQAKDYPDAFLRSRQELHAYKVLR